MATPPSSSTAPASTSSQFTYANASSSSSYFPMPFHLQQPQTINFGILVLEVFGSAVISKGCTDDSPEALESVKAALANSEIEHKAEAKKKAIPRKAAGQSWGPNSCRMARKLDCWNQHLELDLVEFDLTLMG
ncbi:RNA-binding protein 42-like isoform X2 [Prunus yedoensis var. nudiflora]|uniref:RNA-binding protein 42-like isoform X2 n=1 Tax=Prunus yedoensis var. nudiflora TaxID=2094558 RepID=A0A314ZB98_PRUYE|nr:RNA-binding protein 42-like isoform X2 [Prunus yedoensis var. nudiflora]